MVPNCRSSGVVTSDSMTCGLAPGNCVETWMVGKSTFGSAEIGSPRYPSAPSSSTAIISKVVAIGREMKGSETLTCGFPHAENAETRTAKSNLRWSPLSPRERGWG